MTGEGWFLTGEMMELIENDVPNIVCLQPFGCLPNHIVGKGMIKELRRRYPQSNIVAIDYDPGASEVNQINRIKLMLSNAYKNLEKKDDNININNFENYRMIKMDTGADYEKNNYKSKDMVFSNFNNSAV
ncbi:hypothetical protein PWK10_01530 [Caloramator sp. Dgby_cultured_2]|nr:hypothetical protein [Caloramator sp. Dgby_cultured_2]WDU83409.1 hypothetical protein PWK10_01530 [Caloramator sp. Dgby_cultured_2]